MRAVPQASADMCRAYPVSGGLNDLSGVRRHIAAIGGVM